MISVFCVLGLNWILCIYIHLHNVFLFLSQDYKTYLDFVLALENRKEPAALQYIFKLLDMENRGYLNVFSLNYFFRVSIAHASHKHALMTEYLICIYSLHLHHQFLILAPDHMSQDVASLFCFVFFFYFFWVYISTYTYYKNTFTLSVFFQYFIIILFCRPFRSRWKSTDRSLSPSRMSRYIVHKHKLTPGFVQRLGHLDKASMLCSHTQLYAHSPTLLS